MSCMLSFLFRKPVYLTEHKAPGFIRRERNKFFSEGFGQGVCLLTFIPACALLSLCSFACRQLNGTLNVGRHSSVIPEALGLEPWESSQTVRQNREMMIQTYLFTSPGCIPLLSHLFTSVLTKGASVTPACFHLASVFGIRFWHHPFASNPSV